MGDAELRFRMADYMAPKEILDVTFSGCIDETADAVTLNIVSPRPGGGCEWELCLDFTAEQVRALRAFCDLALTLTYKGAPARTTQMETERG